jgi:hypothetical protein
MAEQDARVKDLVARRCNPTDTVTQTGYINTVNTVTCTPGAAAITATPAPTDMLKLWSRETAAGDKLWIAHTDQFGCKLTAWKPQAKPGQADPPARLFCLPEEEQHGFESRTDWQKRQRANQTLMGCVAVVETRYVVDASPSDQFGVKTVDAHRTSYLVFDGEVKEVPCNPPALARKPAPKRAPAARPAIKKMVQRAKR